MQLKTQDIKHISFPPHKIFLILTQNGWYIKCDTNSPLNNLFKAFTPTDQIINIVQGPVTTHNMYPVTNNLDNSIKIILDMLTAIRYKTNQIQLPLLTDDLFKD